MVTAVMTAYSASFKTMDLAKAKIGAVALANEKMENIRNMPYDSLATEYGPIYPPGNIKDDETIVRKGIEYNTHTVISYVDDPYDGNAEGTIPDKPTDLYPYDYKKVEVSINKIGRNGKLTVLTSNVSAKAAETPSNTGILKICVINSNYDPVPDADVTITNPETDPPVNISAKTGSDGCIMIPSLPPNLHNHYHLTATKGDFSIDMTYERTAQNPNALQPDIDILAQQVTDITLQIDLLSKMIIDVVDNNNAPVPNAQLHIEGTKRIYFNPDTKKYSQDLTADANGHLEIENMEFDDYSITVQDWNIVTTSPYQPVGLKANTTLNVKIVGNNTPGALAITGCDPMQGIVNNTLIISITGRNINPAATIKLVNGSGAEIAGTGVLVENDILIEANFDLHDAVVGTWDIVITNPTESVRQLNGFEIKPAT